MRLFVAAAVSALSLVLSFTNANAQSFPSRPIKIIVPYGAGGVDVQLRVAQTLMEASLGQPVVVENRPGGGAILGTTVVRNAPADGYTLLYTGTSALSVIPQMKRVTYSMSDFIPIGNVTGTALSVVAREGAPYKSLTELIAYAKQNPGKVTMASSGVGTTTHMIGEALQVAAGVKFTHVPYTGMAQSIGGMLSGTADMSIGVPGAFMAQIKSGALRVLATTGSKRSEFLPDAPTLQEAGVNLVEETKFGVLAPKGVDPAIVTKLANALKAAVQSKEFTEKMHGMNTTPFYLDPTGLASALRQENELWGALLKRPEFKDIVEK